MPRRSRWTRSSPTPTLSPNTGHRNYIAYLAPPAFASRLPALTFTRDPTGVSG
jgi:hypothetical protein